jgi:Holliday junction resolvase RusA-like endonuclease
MISFTVPGEPVPQPRPRVSTRGGFARAYVPSQHPVHAYRQAVALAAKLAGLGTITEPIQVCVVSVFERPKSHVTGRGVVKATAPRVPRPDVDNIAKAVLDALGDFFDDTLVESLQVSKSYGTAAHTKVVIG